MRFLYAIILLFLSIQIVAGSYISDEVLVQYTPSWMSLFSAWNNNEQSSVEVVPVEEWESVEEAILRLQNEPGVLHVQPNYVYSLLDFPTDIHFDKQWYLYNDWSYAFNGVDPVAGADIDRLNAMALFSGVNNPSLWQNIVAVIDNGVLHTHEDLSDKMRDGSGCLDKNWGFLWGCVHGYDFLTNTPSGLSQNSDSHGTAIAGIIGASTNNNLGIAWVNPSATIMSLRTFSGSHATTPEIIDAIKFAWHNGAKIINASFGGTGDDILLSNAIADFDWLFIVAAGNKWRDHNDINVYPCDYSVVRSNVICVWATTHTDALAWFSDFGEGYVQVAAPGLGIYSASWSVTGYDWTVGTSFSAPIVAGMASLLWSWYPQADMSLIKDAILMGVDDLWLPVTTSGRVNLYNSMIYLQDQVFPEPFFFDDITDALPNFLYTSNIVTVTGMDQAVPVWVHTGEYSINEWVWSGAGQIGYISSGDTLQMRFTTSPASRWLDYFISVYVGWYETSFDIFVTERDIYPDPFTFIPVVNAVPGLLYESNSITISGINTGAYVTVDTGRYNINDGLQTWDNTMTGVVYSGDTFTVSFIPHLRGTVHHIWVTVWDYSTDFTLESLAEWFVFDSLTGVLPLTVYESNVVTLTWFVDSLEVVVNNGEYRIGAGGWTSDTWSVVSWDTLQLRTTSSWVPNQFDGASIAVGNYSANFLVAPMESWLLSGESIFFTWDRRHYNVTGISLFIDSNTGVDYRIFGQNLTTEYVDTLGSDFNEILLELNGMTGITYVWTVLWSGGDERYFTDYVVYDIQAPVLDSVSLISGQTVYGTSVLITGTVTDDFALGEIPGFDLDCDYTWSDITTCNFSWEVQLQSGNFTVLLYLHDKAGNLDIVSIPVYVDVWDRMPDAFSFTAQNNITRSTAVESNVITIAGIDTGVDIGIVGGQYKIGTGDYTSATGTVSSGDTVQLRLTSSSSYSTTSTAVLTVGWLSGSWSVTTQSAPVSPGPTWWWPTWCNPSSVVNGTVNSSTCEITCDTWYTLSGTQCLLSDDKEQEDIESTPWDIEDFDIVYELFDTTSVAPLSASALVIPENDQCAWQDELQQAYQFAYGIGITTMPTARQARLCDGVIRSELAKMVANYAIQIHGLSPDEDRVCHFDDIADQSAEMKYYIKLVCQLGIMGVGLTHFNPYGTVDRAQWGTVLSRILYGDQYNNGDPYYIQHLSALNTNGIIVNTNPALVELRSFVMLMMMRAGN